MRVLFYLKAGIDPPYRMLFDLTAIDERVRTHRQGPPGAEFHRGLPALLI